MSERPMYSNNGQDLWARVLETMRERVGLASFETWFRPIAFAGWDETSCKLVVPNQFFRRCFLDYYSDILQQAMDQLVDTPLELQVSAAEAEAVTDEPQPLPVVHASALESETAQKPWLIEQLWTRGAVGIVGGPPKLLKTWLALEMAVSVASRSPCLGTFPIHASGPVLLFAAEDSQPKVRARLESLARHHGFDLEQIDIQVITAETLRLDRPQDQEKLAATVMLHKPVLLVLDPLVRLHSLDENQSGPMAALLGYFRALQRKTNTAIALIHHARKNISSHAGAGYTLRGSGDLYAWVDSFICLQRRRDRVTLLAEHRSAPGLGPLPIELTPSSAPDQAPYLRLASVASVVADETPEHDPLPERILNLLECSDALLTTDSMRSSLHVRKQRVVDTLRRLCKEGVIVRNGNRYAPRNPKG
jgi:AAA domain/DnaA N-terminal domain